MININFKFILIMFVVLLPMIDIFSFVKITTNIQYSVTALITFFILLNNSHLRFKKIYLFSMIFLSLYPHARSGIFSLEIIGALVTPFMIYTIWTVFSKATERQTTLFIYVIWVLAILVFLNLTYQDVYYRNISADLSLYLFLAYVISYMQESRLIRATAFVMAIFISFYVEARIIILLSLVFFVLEKVGLHFIIRKLATWPFLIFMILTFISIVYYEFYYLQRASDFFSGRGIIWNYYVFLMLDNYLNLIIGLSDHSVYRPEILNIIESRPEFQYILSNNMYHNGFLSIFYKTGIIGLLVTFYIMLRYLKIVRYEYLGLLVYLVFSLYYFMNGKFIITLDLASLSIFIAGSLYYAHYKRTLKNTSDD